MSTGIEWTDETWNPVVGCNQVSPGCAKCYAKELHDKRHKAYLAGKRMLPQYAQPFEVVQLKPERFEAPLHWRKPRRVFVNSVSDLFHYDVPDTFLDRVFAVMQASPGHTFQVLTKRPERMREYIAGAELRVAATCEEIAHEHEWCHAHDDRPWPLSNVWLGASVENQRFADERIPLLLQTPAAVRFLSCEPLLGPVDLTCIGEFEDDSDYRLNGLTGEERYPGSVRRGILPGVDWVIVGGESGSKARPMALQWPRSILKQCQATGVACFVKQLGARPVTPDDLTPEHSCAVALRDRKGGNPAEWPDDLRVRQFPAVRS
jgi:protein gp37